MKKRYILLLSTLLLCSCATLTKSYRSEEKYKLKESSKLERDMSIVKFKTDRDGESRFELRSPLINQVVIYGSYEEQSDNTADRVVLYVERVRLFANWPNGWTEAHYEASGRLVLTAEGEKWRCALEEPLELWEILSGELRHYDTFYRGEEGMSRVKNRVDRLRETAKLLNDRGFPAYYGHLWRESGYSSGFKKEVGRYLFPELYRFKQLEKADRLPAAYYESSELPEGSLYSLGANRIWRRDYTLRVFPENFHQLRDSGALYRDFEEASQLLFSLYNLDYYSGRIVNGELFTEETKR